MSKPKQDPPPLHTELLSPGVAGARANTLYFARQRIGTAFDGIENYNFSGRFEPLSEAVERFTRQHRLPVTLDTLVALAERINELSAIVQQNALTADDAPQAGWGIPADTAGSQEPKETEDATPLGSECCECGATDAGALSPGGRCVECELSEPALHRSSEFGSPEDTTQNGSF